MTFGRTVTARLARFLAAGGGRRVKPPYNSKSSKCQAEDQPLPTDLESGADQHDILGHKAVQYLADVQFIEFTGAVSKTTCTPP